MSLISAAVALSSASTAFVLLSPSLRHLGVEPAHVEMALPTFEPKQFLAEIRHLINEHEAQLALCEDEEECMLQDAYELDQEMNAAESSSSNAEDVAAAKHRAALMETVKGLRDEASDVKAYLTVLYDQKRSAVAMLWDDRMAERRKRAADMDIQA